MNRWLTHVMDVTQGKTTWGKPRSPIWPRVRKIHLKHVPACEICSTKKKLEVHHVIPFNKRPDLELDFRNLRTLCRACHFWAAHFKNWKRDNPEIAQDIVYWKNRLDAVG